MYRGSMALCRDTANLKSSTVKNWEVSMERCFPEWAIKTEHSAMFHHLLRFRRQDPDGVAVSFVELQML